MTILLLLVFSVVTKPESTLAQSPNGVVKPNDIVAVIAFSLLKKDLPEGTEMKSSFRTSQDQLRILRHFAEIEGLSIPPMRVEDPKSWGPLLAQVRSLGYKIAEPGKSPHEDENKIVIDLSRTSLPEIQKGCENAERKGLIHIYNKILERKNNAFHLEFDLRKSALSMLGLDPQLVKSGEDEGELKSQIIAGMREKSLQDSDDPAIRAERLKKLQEMSGLVNYGDQAYFTLQDEIKSYQEQAQRRAEEEKKTAERTAIIEAQEQGEWEIAEQKAEEFVRAYGDQSVLSRVRAERKYQDAVELAYPLAEEPLPCESCKEAFALVEDAIQILETSTPKLSAAMQIKLRTKLGGRISECQREFWLRVILGVTFSLAVLIGLFFAFRPGKLVIYCEDGDQRGESFPLNQPEMIIGSLGEPDGDAQIVINDRKRKISRSHCVIRQNGRRFYLKDLESANGTSVNGLRLEKGQYHMLKKGDEISLAGAITLIVRRA